MNDPKNVMDRSSFCVVFRLLISLFFFLWNVYDVFADILDKNKRL
jgi:hypothetical protein